MTFEYRDDHQLTLRINRLEPDYPGQTITPAIWIETSDGFFSRTAVKVPAARVEEVVAGIRDAARTAARQTTGQDDTEPAPCVCDTEPEACAAVGEDPTTADDPIPLRWGLGDVEHGDDDTVTVYLSGPDREPYWLELDPERAAALRDDLTPPGDEPLAAIRRDLHEALVVLPAPEADRVRALVARLEAAARATVGQPAEAHDTDRAAILREAADLAAAHNGCPCNTGHTIAHQLRRMAVGGER
ncbi:hypothetical protein [Streptosporangium amethystogenes]|uniref:hypothetical protein n=1 Tax=Streptosporangium amethystogenes TaxID=2002 RepID=UPI0004BDC3F8|nr:hypothetical protein [Streptosporangium amethystogenes]KUJ65419.1 hypothetical protein ACZ90_47955 [Streptomyces albus subsp. albus]